MPTEQPEFPFDRIVPKLHIIIEDGDIFEGTQDQFADSFGGPSDKKSVLVFCALRGWKVQCMMSPIGKTIKSISMGTSNQWIIYFTDDTSLGIIADTSQMTDIKDLPILRLQDSKS